MDWAIYKYWHAQRGEEELILAKPDYKEDEKTRIKMINISTMAE